MGREKGETYSVGCAHCGELVYQFVIGDKPIGAEMENLPEHNCKNMKAPHSGVKNDY